VRVADRRRLGGEVGGLDRVASDEDLVLGERVGARDVLAVPLREDHECVEARRALFGQGRPVVGVVHPQQRAIGQVDGAIDAQVVGVPPAPKVPKVPSGVGR
jgi:hypothetical protein